MMETSEGIGRSGAGCGEWGKGQEPWWSVTRGRFIYQLTGEPMIYIQPCACQSQLWEKCVTRNGLLNAGNGRLSSRHDSVRVVQTRRIAKAFYYLHACPNAA